MSQINTLDTNPLNKYFRQPKLYIQIPSRGKYYQQGAISILKTESLKFIQ